MSHIWVPPSGPTPRVRSSTQSDLQTVRIDVPLGSEHLVLIVPHEDEERQASAMENLLQASASKKPFSLEIVGTRREQGFVLRDFDDEQRVLHSKQISAQYSQAELQHIAPAADPLVLHVDEHALVGTFTLTQPSWMPLKTFTGKMLAEPGADPLAGLLAAMEPLGSGERIICQLALVRAPEHWMARHLRKAVEHPLQAERDAAMKGTSPSSSSREGLKTLLLAGGLFGAMLAYRWYSTRAWFPLTLLVIAVILTAIGFLWWWARQSRQDIYDMKLVSEKLSRAAFYTSLRVIVIGKRATSRQQQLRAHLTRLEVAYRQFTLASANSLALKRVVTVTPKQRQAAALIHAASAFPYHHWLRRFLHGGAWSSDVWNSLEVSGAFHLPQALTDLPLVRRLSVKHLLASPEIARHLEQETVPMPAALVGFSRHRGYTVPVYLPYQTLFSHLFLVARSRYGKSTLIQLLARAALHPVTDGSLQPGLFIIDPHKDLVDDLLYAIPPERASEVVLLDLTDTQQIVALNPLDASMGWSRDQAIANLMSCFERIWHDFWGPRMSYFLKAVCLLLYTLNQKKVQQGQRNEQYTLLDINPLLQYPEYATQVLSELDLAETWHQELLAWWQQVYFALPRHSSFRSEVIMPIISKMGVFSDNQQLRRVVGQPITKAPVHEAIAQGKVVLCALSAREMDEAAVNVLGSTLINLLHRGFGMQQQVPPETRRKVFCAVDEFHAFSGGDFDRLLSEDAKFGCALLLATQNLKRLNHLREGLLEMVLSNCDNLFAFNVSAADAKLVEDELRGRVEQRHILAQPRFHCYARLSLPGYPLQILSMTLATPPGWQRSVVHQRAAAAIRQDNLRHTTPASEIDQRYAQHLEQFLDVIPFAKKLQREVREAAHGKQERAAADQLEHEQRKPSPASPAMPQPSSATSAQPKEQDGTPAGIGSSLAGGSSARRGASAQEQKGQKEKRTNHVRSKRQKFSKDPVDIPPSEPSLDLSQEPPDVRPRFPLRGPGGWSSRGGERERGE